MEAVKHLHAAGLHVDADMVKQKVERFKHELRERHSRQDPGMHARKRLAYALGEIKREIQQLREEISAIKSSMGDGDQESTSAVEETSNDGGEIAGTF